MLRQSGLFAAVEAQLLVFVKAPTSLPSNLSPNDPRYTALFIFGYWALLFNCSSAVTSFVLSYEFRKLPVRAAQTRDLFKTGIIVANEMQLLQIFGASPSTVIVMIYCECDMLPDLKQRILSVLRVCPKGRFHWLRASYAPSYKSCYTYGTKNHRPLREQPSPLLSLAYCPSSISFRNM
jgi:hypothetical protein